MNVRAATVFFWGFLVASAALASEEYRSELKIAVETDGDEAQVFEWHSDDPDADRSKLEEAGQGGKVIFIDDSDLSAAGQLHGEY